MDLFDRMASSYDWLHWSARSTADRLFKLGAFSADDVVLDLGGGTGRIASFFVGKVKKIVVADASEGMINQCRKKEGLDCVLVSEKLPFEDSSFDKVIIVDAFHHFEKQELAIKELRRVLKDNGTIIVAELNKNNFWGNLVVLMEHWAGFGSRFFRPSEFKNLWENNGFIADTLDADRWVYYLKARK